MEFIYKLRHFYVDAPFTKRMLAVRFISRRFLTDSVSKNLIVQLRNETGAGYSICREALMQTRNDKILAMDFIRKKLRDRSDLYLNKSVAVTNGLIGVGKTFDSVALVKINCQTDFVARTARFHELVAQILETVLLTNTGSTVNDFSSPRLNEDVVNQLIHHKNSIKNIIGETSGLVGEKIEIDSVYKINHSFDYFSCIYAHQRNDQPCLNLSFINSFGRIGSIVVLKKTDEIDSIEKWGRLLARQVTGVNPFQDTGSEQSSLEKLLGQQFLSEPHLTVQDLITRESLSIATFAREEHLC